MKKLLLLFCLVGCSGFETRVRSPKNLDTMNGILYSNTQNNPYKVKVDKKTLYLNYDLILKNTSATVRNFNLGDSKLLFNDIKKDLSCVTVGKGEFEFILKPNQMIGVKCSAVIEANNLNKLTKRDTEIKLFVSLEKETVLNFSYFTFVEDFQ